ncbi:hypothetical protein NDU88_002964 [Pleurodeles waltl]|uniref:Serine/arginine-rich splicing factor 7 n=1 Tax=Pleurodeles waltl TaxID=8319 RepID=A0AAV7LDX7_PLEWA|nr:hypothetical protein NDU88_002964 [Pleurodeles waltl]
MSRFGGRYSRDEFGSSSRQGGREPDGERKVFVGNLAAGAGKGEVERAFRYYGPLRSVWIARNPPGFAFVEFEDPRDAEDAVRGLDGNKEICGSRVRVELSSGRPRRSGYDRPPARGGFDPSDRCYDCGERGHYAYDCHRFSGRRRRSRSRSRSQSRSRGRRRSRSRSRSRGRRTRSPSPRRSRSSPRRSGSAKRSRSRSRSRSGGRGRSRSVSRGRGRSASPAKSRSQSRSPSPRK